MPALRRVRSYWPLNGKSTRVGLCKCYSCRKPFHRSHGDQIFESSHLPLNLWLQVIHLMCAKKESAAVKFSGCLQCSMKTAWFLSSTRIREAMTANDLEPFGSMGGAVEIDETYYGRKAGVPVGPGGEHKHTIVTLVDRDSGQAHSRVIAQFNFNSISEIVSEAMSPKARPNTPTKPRLRRRWPLVGLARHCQPQRRRVRSL